MNLIKTSLLNGIAVAVKMVTLLGLNKILAVYIGPAGFASIGQFQNALQMLTTFTGGAITNGVVKYTAEYDGQAALQHRVWKVAGTITVIGSLVISTVVAVFHNELAVLFLHHERYGTVFLWMAAGITFFSLNTLLLAIINGKKEVVLYVVCNIVGSFISLVLTVSLVVGFGLQGALVALVLYQSIGFFVSLFLCMKKGWFRVGYLFGSVDIDIVKKLFAFFLMAAVSSASVPIGQMLVRHYIGSTFGWEVAGYWEALSRLSAAYLLLVTTTLSVYYLPRFSEIKNGKDIQSEILQGYKFILPVAMLAGLSIYILRDFIVLVLFTNDFSPMRVLFAGQVVGDSLKVVSWIIAFVMISKAMVKRFIVMEVVFCISFYFITVLISKAWGGEYITWGYALNYLAYCFAMYFFVYRDLGRQNIESYGAA